MNRWSTFSIKAIRVVKKSHSSIVTMSLNKKERALIVKLFYQNNSNALAALQAYRWMKNLRREPMNLSGVKLMIRKFDRLSGCCTRKGATCNCDRGCGGNCNSWSNYTLFKCYCKWPLNSTSTRHSVRNRANDFTQNSEAVSLQIALRATFKAARTLCASSFCLEFSGENASVWVLAVAYLVDRRGSFSLRRCCEYTELPHMEFLESSCRATTTVTFSIRQGMV